MKRWRHLDKFRTFLVDKSVIFFWYHVQIDLILLCCLWLRISLLSKRCWQPCLSTSTTWTTHSRAIDICIACNLALAKPPLALLRLSPSLSRLLSPLFSNPLMSTRVARERASAAHRPARPLFSADGGGKRKRARAPRTQPQNSERGKKIAEKTKTKRKK